VLTLADFKLVDCCFQIDGEIVLAWRLMSSVRFMFEWQPLSRSANQSYIL
jgi:hypothetical protein